jgi:hypothetical protein
MIFWYLNARLDVQKMHENKQNLHNVTHNIAVLNDDCEQNP